MRLIVTILLLFTLAQLIGIYAGITVLLDLHENPFVSSLVVTTDSEEPANALVFISYILLGALSMVLLIRLFGLYPIIFRIMEFVLISTSSSVVFYALLRIFAGYGISTMGAIGLGLVFAGLKAFRPRMKNAAAVLATAGVGVIFGISLGVIPLILFLILLSVYDYLSVFTTKHMVEMANYIVKKNLAFTISAIKPPKKPGMPERRIDLGTGDVIAPIMLEVSALSVSPWATAFVFLGAVVSMGIFLHLVWKKGMVLPALPPIVLGMIISLSVGFLLGVY